MFNYATILYISCIIQLVVYVNLLCYTQAMKGVKNMIGMNLKALRKAKGYSQEEVAEKMNVSRQSVAKWENDESIPDVIKCSELANLYEISLDELVHNKISVDEEQANGEEGKYVFGIVKVGERGQIVIPKHARDVFDIKPGDNLLVVGDVKRGLGIGKLSRSIASDFVFEE